jgi:hypothetical protein
MLVKVKNCKLHGSQCKAQEQRAAVQAHVGVPGGAGTFIVVAKERTS